MIPSDFARAASQTSIVFADNNNFVLEAIREPLRGKGYDVHLAQDGLEALQLIRRIRPTCVGLDVVMPKLDGSRVCWLVRQGSHLRDTPIIVSSSLSAQAFRHFPDLNASAYVAKGEISAAFPEHPVRYGASPGDGTDNAGGILGYDEVKPREIVTDMLMEMRRYANVLGALVPGTIEMDVDGRILRISAGACEILGRNETQSVGELVTPPCPARDQRTLMNRLHELTTAAPSERCRAVVRF